ncbi:hypothetical protein [Qipengyuania sp.]|uniref:hypothetical protein n=1 Tax=Qipengyuania sp. TaxID=2004515 RepID=UPI003735D1A7
MAIFDKILGAAHNHPTVNNLADKLGIDPADAERAIAALGEAHNQDGDTVDLAAARTGMDRGTLSQIVEHIGGESSLARFSQMLDADHDGNPLDDLADHASRLFGKN